MDHIDYKKTHFQTIKETERYDRWVSVIDQFC